MVPHLYDKHLSLDIHCVPNPSEPPLHSRLSFASGERAPPSSPAASEKTPPTSTRITLHRRSLSTQRGSTRKETEARFGRGCRFQHSSRGGDNTIFEPNKSSMSAQPQTSDEAAVDVSALPPGLVHKLGLVGGMWLPRSADSKLCD